MWEVWELIGVDLKELQELMISRLNLLTRSNLRGFAFYSDKSCKQQRRFRTIMASETNAAQANAALADSDGPTIFDKIISKQVCYLIDLVGMAVYLV